MRITGNNGPDDWRHHWQHVAVYLDGAEVRDCIEADDVKGYVITYVRLPGGSMANVNGQLVTRRRDGRVTLVGIPHDAADLARHRAAQAAETATDRPSIA